MGNIGSKRQEKQRIQELKEGIVLALHNQGKPRQWIAKTIDDKYNLVCRVIGRGISLEKRFEPAIAEQLVTAAQRIADFSTYQIELDRISEQTKPSPERGPRISMQAITISYKKMYAERMADLWAGFQTNKPSHIVKYQDTVIAPKIALEGRLMVIPKEVLPVSVRDTRAAKRPYLVMMYEGGRAELCDEEAGTVRIKIRGIGTLHKLARKNAKNPVLPLQALLSEQERIICIDYFKRNNYDMRGDLYLQIRERALNQIAPVALQERLQLPSRALYRETAK
jgi:hypothetical protein